MKKRITLAMLLLFSAQAAFARSKPHYVFLLPDGYMGWVQVISQSKDAPPPVVEKGNLLVDLDDSGVFRTPAFHTVRGRSRRVLLQEKRCDGKDSQSADARGIRLPSNEWA
jgi:hypothetical protein